MLIKRLSQIYTPEIVAVSPQTPASEAIRQMQQKHISCILVQEEKKPVGIITERAIVSFAAKSGINFDQWQTCDLMRSPVFTAHPDTDIFSAYNLLTSQRIRHLVVVDDEDQAVGVVTLTDIIEYLGHDYFVELKTVDQIMSKILCTMPREALLQQALIQLAEISASCLIITEGKRPVGIITERDMTWLLLDRRDLNSLKVEEVMSTPVHKTERHIPVLDAARIMKENTIRRVVVVDQDDTIVGLITQSDIVKELEGSYINNLKNLVQEKTLHLENALSILEARTLYLDNILRSSINLGIVATDLDFEIKYFNPAAEQILGRRAADVIGCNARNIHKQLGRGTDIFDMVTETIKKNKSFEFSFNQEQQEGQRYISARISGIWNKKHELFGYVLMLEDVTERKQAEAQIKIQKTDLEEMNSKLSMLYEVTSKISHIIDMPNLLHEVLDVIISLKILKVERKGGIFILEGDQMKLVSHLGHSDEFIELHKNMRVGQCLCGLAALTGEIILSANCTQDKRHTIRTLDEKPHGHVILPLIAKKKVVGVLYLYTSENFQGLDVNEMHLLSTIGDQIGIAIENSRLYEETKYLSYYDPLTKLANRRLMHICLESNFAGAKRYGKPLSVIMIDIDHFKAYNDTHGHQAGDALLASLGALLLDEIREPDTIARYGGEEMLIILPLTKREDACILAERIRKKVEAELNTTVSLGVAQYHEEMTNNEQLIRQADDALYRAKQKGRNRVEH